jgi:lipopolysaccharide/colanic/teichoic acid biosynthesis glycosyltransferase
MEQPLKEELKILYIGGDVSIINQFENTTEVKLFNRENSLSALRWLDENKVLDAILCDMYIPGMSGIDIFKFLKSKNIHTKTPFILISHTYDPKIQDEAYSLHIDDCYFTPLNEKDILSRIKFLKKYISIRATLQHTPTTSHEYRIPFLKRSFDIFIAGTALLILSPILLIIALAIRIESKGRVYYISKRVGTGYKVFDFYKFRSMYVGADSRLSELKHLNQYEAEIEEKNNAIDELCPECERLGHYCSPTLFIEGKEICENYYLKIKKEKSKSAFIKIKDDPRITKIGKFIRNTSIDELPQLINVLKGDMSIVGNRPLPLYEAELLTSDQWGERFLGPAGITGLWQVNKRGKGTMLEEERKQLDNQYASNNSFWGDLKIILMTIPALFQKENV